MNGPKDRRSITSVRRMMWYYAGIGGPTTPAGQRLAALTSSYRLPEVVVALATDPDGRGEYEIADHVLGRAADGLWTNPHYRLLPDSGILRYAWCTPDFIMGLPVVPPLKCTQWTKISSQGRWHGVIFRGDRDARIFVQCGRRKSSNNNQQMGVQRKGTMITQRLKEGYYAKGTVDTRVWVSRNGLTNVIEERGWVFVEAPGAYAAVRPARGSYTWVPYEGVPPNGNVWRGRWMVFEDDYAPVIIEVVRKRDVVDYAAFRAAVAATRLRWDGPILNYRSLGGDEFTFPTNWEAAPSVNGRTPTYTAPQYAFRSPFIRSKWDSGIVDISYNGSRLRLDYQP
jgi:hypothetical protein